MNGFAMLFVSVFTGLINANTPANPESTVVSIEGKWQFNLDVGNDGVSVLLPFVVEFDIADAGQSNLISAKIINDPESIDVPGVGLRDGKLSLDISHYASSIELKETPVGSNRWQGDWTKRRGQGEPAVVPCSATRWEKKQWSDPATFLGRWSVKFDDSDDPAVGIFRKAVDSNQVHGTFLTTTGDYRYLAGGVTDGQLRLSCFDGAHAFLFIVNSTAGGLEGTFHSGSWYQTKWVATRDDQASLPDAFGQTVWLDKVKLSDLNFPDLDGNVVSLADPEFDGKCRIIEVFGSWCPNCHDAGAYLTELHEKYHDQGLSIVGLAFELTGDFETDADQVRKFISRNNTHYPVLIAGTADKADATRQLGALDRVRSYPTMIFIDQADKVRAVYTGFSGPATGPANTKLRLQFEKIIESMLDQE